MKTVANYPEDFTCKYSSDEFNYGKAELYLSGGIGLWKKTGKHYDEVEKIFQKLIESEGEIPFS